MKEGISLRDFYDLLSEEEVTSARVTLQDGDKVSIHTDNGFIGVFQTNLRFESGQLVEVIYSGEIENDLPVFKLTEKWINTHVPNKGTVCVITQTGIGIVFEEEGKILFGKYKPEIFPEELRQLNLQQMVNVSVEKQEQDEFILNGVLPIEGKGSLVSGAFKSFYDLLSVGEKTSGRVTLCEGGNVFFQTDLGYNSLLETDLKLATAEKVDVLFSGNFRQGLPVFTPTEDWKLKRIPRVGTICVKTKKGFGVVFEPSAETNWEKVVGFYTPETFTPELERLALGQKVSAYVSNQSDNKFVLRAIESYKETTKATNQQPKTIRERDGIRCDMVVSAFKINETTATFGTGLVGTFVGEARPPRGVKHIIVKVVKITTNSFDVVYIRPDTKHQELPANVDPTIHDTAISAGSLHTCSNYCIGGEYIFKVVNGEFKIPFDHPRYAELNAQINSIDVELERHGLELKNGERYNCRVLFIKQPAAGAYVVSLKILHRAV